MKQETVIWLMDKCTIAIGFSLAFMFFVLLFGGIYKAIIGCGV